MPGWLRSDHRADFGRGWDGVERCDQVLDTGAEPCRTVDHEHKHSRCLRRTPYDFLPDAISLAELCHKAARAWIACHTDRLPRAGQRAIVDCARDAKPSSARAACREARCG